MFNFFKFKKTKQQPTALSLPEPKEEKKLRIAYTVYPDERLEYNEFWKRIYEEAKKI
jgi:hypothetical protein